MGAPPLDFAEMRARMVRDDIAGRGIRDPAVLHAMAQVPREEFVRPRDRAAAYDDRPLPIGEHQTVSQPYVVAIMLQLLELDADTRLLEVGSGCGYAAAVAGTICDDVIGVERLPGLAHAAAERLERLGYGNVTIVVGDGTLGWSAGAPYDAILVSAGAPDTPDSLVDQLAPGGRLVVPVGSHGLHQNLIRIRRTPSGIEGTPLGAVAFVPLVGEQGWPDER